MVSNVAQPRSVSSKSGKFAFTPILGWSALVLLIAGLLMAFLVAPRAQAASGGDVQRIFYFHVPSAWVGFGVWSVTAYAGWRYLKTRNLRYDRIASAASEVCVVFITMMLLSGMLWGKPVWNAFWTWEAKLTFSALQSLMYLAYLLLRSGIDDPHRKARFAAIYALLGAALIPFNFLVSRVLETVHPAVFGPSVNAKSQGGFGVPVEMIVVLMVCLTAFTLLAWFFIRVRVGLLEREELIETRRVALIGS